jgi:hypothetical protein
MVAQTYLPHVLYSVAVISLSMHLVSERKTSSDERARMNARISILQSISEQLQSGRPLLSDDLERTKRLTRFPEQSLFEFGLKDPIGWKEVIFGQKGSSTPQIGVWDQKDIEKGEKLFVIRRTTSHLHFPTVQKELAR